VSYFIAGLPRSRTAWLSVFMSQSGIYCHHDGFNGCSSLGEYKDKVKGCGDSSTGLTVIDINQEFPDSKVVVIDKNEEELKRCIEWCKATYGGDAETSLKALYDKHKEIKGLHIKQYEIDNSLQKIWEYLVDTPWNDRYQELSNFNITSDPFNIDIEAARSLYASIQQDIIRS